MLFSTHILSDVEVVCTRAGILRDGVLGRELRLDELARLGADSVEVLVRGLDATVVERLASRASGCVRSGDSLLFTVAPGAPVHELVSAVLGAGGILESVVPRRQSLEDVYVGTAGSGALRPEPALDRAATPRPESKSVLVGGR